jgi:hypothetical protein
MLKFTTTTPFNESTSIEMLLKTKPLIKLEGKTELISCPLRGREAVICGKALELAGFYMPFFFEGDLSELDSDDPCIRMVLPSGEYPIRVCMTKEGIYNMDIA